MIIKLVQVYRLTLSVNALFTMSALRVLITKPQSLAINTPVLGQYLLVFRPLY